LAPVEKEYQTLSNEKTALESALEMLTMLGVRTPSQAFNFEPTGQSDAVLIHARKLFDDGIGSHRIGAIKAAVNAAGIPVDEATISRVLLESGDFVRGEKGWWSRATSTPVKEGRAKKQTG
jgi:hypothetical protein